MKVTVEKPQIISLFYLQEKGDADYGSCMWARFHLDTKNYSLSIDSDCGSYSYGGWVPTPDAESFLQLLCRMDGEYLLGKLSCRDLIDGAETYKALQELLDMDSIELDADALSDLEKICNSTYNEYELYGDLCNALKDTSLCTFDIAETICKTYSAGAKKIVSVFMTAIVPVLKEMVTEAQSEEVTVDG